MKNADKVAAPVKSKKAAVLPAATDSELLDFLQQDIEDGGAILLHDGYGNCGMNRGLACVPSGLCHRDLRQAIAAMMPKVTALTASPKRSKRREQTKENK